MDILSSSLQEILSSLKEVGQVMSYTWFIVLPPLFYFLFMELWIAHISGSYAGTLEWVLLEIIPPKNIEKSPKPMEALYNGMAGTEASLNVLDQFVAGKFQDTYSLEIVSDGGDVHMYIRTQKKYRHLVEAHLYSQYPDIEILEVPDYVDDIPKVVPNAEWDLWGADLQSVKKEPGYPIRTYKAFEEDITGKMIDPLAGLAESMGKLPPGQKLWMQIIISAHPPVWNSTVGKKLTDKLKFREVKKDDPWEKFIQDLKDVFGNLWAATQGPVEFEKAKKKEESPLDTRLSPGERDVLKAVEDNLGKIQFLTKIRFLLVGRKENFDKSFVSSFMGGIKQFGDDNLNSLKPEDSSKTYANFIMKKSRLRYRQRKILRRYRGRSRDGVTLTMSSEELATIFHLPDMNVMAPSLSRVEAKRGGAPSNLPIE